MDGGRALFLALAFVTHGIVSYALVREFTDVNPRFGFALALVPDLDLLFPVAWSEPFVHRGITHTLAFVLAIVAVTYLIRLSRSVAMASGLALGSHLLIDSLSPMGVPLLFPFEPTVSGDLPVHGPAGTVVLWTVAIGLLAWRTDALELAILR